MSKLLKTRQRRAARGRAKISGTGDRPRLAVFRSNRFVYAQLIDDEKGSTLVAVSSATVKGKGPKTSVAEKVGVLLAEKAREKGVKKVVFDRRGYKYHGRVKAVAEGARKAGLEF